MTRFVQPSRPSRRGRPEIPKVGPLSIDVRVYVRETPSRNRRFFGGRPWLQPVFYCLELPVSGPTIIWIDAVCLAGDRVVQCLNNLGVSFRFMQGLMFQGHVKTHVLARSQLTSK